mmetsp:Transcript_14665/g.39673  ORF Transcript_14665/g.39673 Transcript_14665/m.39673 type:complete len:248 (-) Transcript_14665:260-1003(-)|eukprot:CAMPEP_0202354804 /NCGR_PEP_ID=MMETSP1126-20121109/9963_1 /ASSEMBLY_ACC=CAM_ASM_000457 /TAXON_ID=3047 /ORGANISM="Dunaliella tertiolecta, Strain CCMP1320" /LENGTH=247 /DNA_ID=CAMNT_0048947315 /DNA_START=59 /DNA_END=802 /DNA_ORIENTATION=+
MQSLQRLQPACTNVNTFASRPNHAALTPRCKPLKATHTETEGALVSNAHDGLHILASRKFQQKVLGAVAAVAVGSLIGLQQPALAAQDVDDSLTKNAVEEYSRLEASGKFSVKGSSMASKTLEDFRSKYRLRRMADGRLQLRSSKGEWFQCRLDMEVPGSMLLRDPKGNVYAIQTEALQQIDLSDDLVALMMFADGDWEKQMSAMEYIDEKGKVKQLQLDDKDFREVVGLLSGLEDAEEAQAQTGRK